VTHSADLAIHFEQKIKSSGGAFVLSHPRSFVNVCFWWVPPALRPFNLSTASKQDLATLGKVIVFHSLLITVAWSNCIQSRRHCAASHAKERSYSFGVWVAF